METRFFSSIGEHVSLLGYGCMRFPTLPGEGDPIDEEKSTALLDAAIAGGVNYFDTAFPYHNQKSEPFLAKALVARYPRDSFLLASKLPTWAVKTEAEADAMFEDQLRRCGVAYFDFFLAHNLSEKHLEEFESYHGYEVLARKKAEGKIRHLGFSFHDSPAHLERVLSGHAWDFVQLQLNYQDWDLQDAKGQYDIAVAHGLPVVVMEPVRGGSLATLNEGARAVLHRAAPERSAASWAIRFAASLPGVMTVLSGMTTPEQVADNLATMTPFVPLSDADRAALNEARGIYRASGTIPCTGCRYCMDCPSGVDIPTLFAIYNQFRLDGDNGKGHFENSYRYLGKTGADACVACGACAPQCPQGIAIPERLSEIRAAYEALTH